MMCSRKLLTVVAVALVGAVILGMPPPATAAEELAISLDGGVTWSTFIGGTVAGEHIVSGTVGGTGFGVTVTGTSNQPQVGATQSQISQISTTFANMGPLPIVVPTVFIALTDTSFTQVSGYSQLSSSLSGTSGAITVAGLAAFQSAQDNNNNAGGGLTSPGITTPFPGAVSAGATTLNNSPVVIPAVLSGTQVINGNTATVFLISTPAYSLSNQLEISGLTLAGGAQLQLTGTTTLVSAVPAPAGLVVKNGSKTRSRCSRGIPMPLSTTLINTRRDLSVPCPGR